MIKKLEETMNSIYTTTKTENLEQIYAFYKSKVNSNNKIYKYNHSMIEQIQQNEIKLKELQQTKERILALRKMEFGDQNRSQVLQQMSSELKLNQSLIESFQGEYKEKQKVLNVFCSSVSFNIKRMMNFLPNEQFPDSEGQKLEEQLQNLEKVFQTIVQRYQKKESNSRSGKKVSKISVQNKEIKSRIENSFI